MRSSYPPNASVGLAEALFDRHVEVRPETFNQYTGIVSLHGLARLATATGDSRLIEKARARLLPYVQGERLFHCNFPNYQCGGNGTAWLLYQGHLPEATDAVRHYADQIRHEAPRNAEGILTHPGRPGTDTIFIDVAFAVTPFLLFTGLALDEPDYVEEAFQQVAKMVGIFRNRENGLLHQCRGFRADPKQLSEDHWSRGNGWGAYALAELACHLPVGHPRKDEAVKLFRDHVAACAHFQDADGLWHQEMTEQLSYVETSGTGLMLYALGAGIDVGLLDAEARGRFEKTLSSLLTYIDGGFNVFHTCHGCLCPGEGTKLDYMARAAVRNDPHAFGPLILALGVAHSPGIDITH